MPRFDLSVHSGAIEINRPGSRHLFHKTSFKDIKLSQLKNSWKIEKSYTRYFCVKLRFRGSDSLKYVDLLR